MNCRLVCHGFSFRSASRSLPRVDPAFEDGHPVLRPSPSHGIVPARSRRESRRRGRHVIVRPEANARIDPRSRSRKSGLTCCAKLSSSSGPGRRSACCCAGCSASAETLEPGVAFATHDHCGTGMWGGGWAPGCEFSSAIREPHSRYATNAARHSGSVGSPASSADLHRSRTQRARCSSLSALPRCRETIRS